MVWKGDRGRRRKWKERRRGGREGKKREEKERGGREGEGRGERKRERERERERESERERERENTTYIRTWMLPKRIRGRGNKK